VPESPDTVMARLRAALRPDRDMIRDYVLNRTFLGGRPFSTRDHYYQDIILRYLSDPDIDFVCHKVAQAGASEIIYRIKLAWCDLHPGYTIALLLPSLKQVQEVMKTRVDNIISESPDLLALRDPMADSTALKIFRNNSIMYALSGRETNTSGSSTITRPIRDITVDELARVDMSIVTAMAVRQRHQEHKTTTYFSTPLFEGLDISYELSLCGEVQASQILCDRCGKYFDHPDFWQQVRLPGYTGQLEDLTLSRLNKYDKDAAYLECPLCYRPTSYNNSRWVDIKGQEANRLHKKGLVIGPFDMPKYVTIPDMLHSLVTMESRDEFCQQVLGQPISRKKSSITKLHYINEYGSGVDVVGIDFGKTSHLLVLRLTGQDQYIVTAVHRIPLGSLRERLIELLDAIQPVCTVADYLPYSEVSTELAATRHNTFVALYNTSPKAVGLYTTKELKDMEGVQQVTIHQLPLFNMLEDLIKTGRVVFADHQPFIKQQLSCMVKVKNKWIKPHGSQSDDHTHHALGYAVTAAKLAAARSGFGIGIGEIHGCATDV